MSVDISAFMQEDSSLAMKFDSKDLPGLLSKGLTVPEGAVALIRQERDDRCLHANSSVSGSFSALLVKTHTLNLKFEIPQLRSEDDIAIKVSVAIKVQARGVELDLLQLRSSLMAKTNHLSQEDIRAHFTPSIEHSLKLFCVRRDAETLTREDQRIGVYQHLRQDL
ncbi:MAG: hypothetical protein P1V97_19315, partial [Planctomycetota bacterium]|nr:hypothetical protein [Planctomycetota bacterium]